MTLGPRIFLVVSAIVAGCGAGRSPSAQRVALPQDEPIKVAITVDDLPRFEDAPAVPPLMIHEAMLAAFARHQTPPVYGFVNGRKLVDHPEDRPALRAWVASGHRLGNHSYSHGTVTSVTRYLADVDANEPLLRELAGDDPAAVRQWKVFRYPSLIEGSDAVSRRAVRRGLIERGYRIAEVTVDFFDWAYNEPYERCASKLNTAAIQILERDYLAAAIRSLRWSDAAAKAFFGRRIVQILLLHISHFDAMMTDQLLTSLEQAGVKLVALDEALADPVYTDERRDPTVVSGTLFDQMGASRRVKAAVAAAPMAPALDGLCR